MCPQRERRQYARSGVHAGGNFYCYYNLFNLIIAGRPKSLTSMCGTSDFVEYNACMCAPLCKVNLWKKVGKTYASHQNSFHTQHYKAASAIARNGLLCMHVYRNGGTIKM